MSIRLLLLTAIAPAALGAAAPAAPAAPAPAAQHAAAPVATADSDLPQSFPADRYNKMIEKSPFAPATPVASAEDTPSFAQNLYITGIGKLGSQDCVFIASRDGQTRYALYSGEEGPQGMKIERITYSSDIGRTKVVVRKGGETGTLSFDQAVIQKTAAPAPLQPVMPGGIPRPAIGGGAFGQRPGMPGQPGISGPQQGGSPVETRRRIRIINSKP